MSLGKLFFRLLPRSSQDQLLLRSRFSTANQDGIGISPEDQVTNEILETSLPYVHELGWSVEAIAKGGKDCGYSGAITGLFPRGAGNLVDFFDKKCNESLVKQMQKWSTQTERPLKVGEFIEKALTTRLLMIGDYIETWPQAVAIKFRPENVPPCSKNVLYLLDDIWFYAGDRSTDFNWYTKRGLLCYVYKTSEFYMIQDGSPDFEETFDFMRRRLADVQVIGKTARNVSQTAESSIDLLSGGFDILRNIMGLNVRR